MKRLRWARRLCLAAAAALLVLAIVGPSLAGAQTDQSNRPDYFVGVAAATGVHHEFDRATGGLSIAIESIYGQFPDGLSVFSTDYGRSRASTFYPGNTARALPGLLCSQTPGDFGPIPNPICAIPPYPFTVEALNPEGPPDATVLGGDVGGGGAPAAMTLSNAHAHADDNVVYSDSKVTGYDSTLGAGSSAAAASFTFRQQAAAIIQGPVAAAQVQPSAVDTVLVHVDSSEAHTHQSFEGSNLVVTANSIVKGVRMLGDAILIDSIQTTSRSTTDGKHEDHVTMGNVSVAGQPAVIDQNGISIVGNNLGNAIVSSLNDALKALLASSGSDVHLITPGTTPTLNSRAVNVTCTGGEADGVLFHAEVKTPQTPPDIYYTTIALGAACTNASAGGQKIESTDLFQTDVGAGGTGATVGVAEPSSPITSSATAAPAAATRTPRRTSAAPTTTRRTRGGLIGDLEADLRGAISNRFSLLYLASALAFVGLCLGSRIFVPARLPGGR